MKTTRGREMKCLIIEDSSLIAKVVSEQLKEMGHEVCHQVNGLKAYEHIKNTNEHYDFILLDWNMPQMTGIEFLEKNFKEKFFQGHIVMMTTENKPDFIMRALQFGAREYIMKPFTKDVLESKLNLIFNDQKAS